MVADERRQAQARAEERARDLEQRVAAERAAARAELAVVARDEWWDKATQQDVARAWTVATAWAPLDQDAAAAAQTIRTQAQARYGVDLAAAAPADPVGADTRRADLRDPYRVLPAHESGVASPALGHGAPTFAVQGSLGLARDHTVREQERGRDESRPATERGAELSVGRGPTLEEAAGEAARARTAARADELTAVAILTDRDPSNDVHGVALYDSAERRSELADRLAHAGVDAEIVDARVVADMGFAAAPAAAVVSPSRAKSTTRPVQQGRQHRQVELGR
ncbi:hypothetical protein ACWFNE_20290 [Cellulomonas sp. NPDC055163]